MSTTISRSDPVPIPRVNNDMSFSYKEIVKQLTAQAPQPYGAIPPLMKKKRQKKKRQPQQPQRRRPIRRMSHVENWVAVDSKESIPDEEELVHSPFENFLSIDFLTGILPLHMPPPSLSDPMTVIRQQEMAKLNYQRRKANLFNNSSDPIDQTTSPTLFTDDEEDIDSTFENFTIGNEDEDEDEEDEDEDEDEDLEEDEESDFSPPLSKTTGRQKKVINNNEKYNGEKVDKHRVDRHPSQISNEFIVDTSTSDTEDLLQINKGLAERKSIPSFTKSHTPSTSTTTSYAMSSSPPDQDRSKWIDTIAKLRQSLAQQPPVLPNAPLTTNNSNTHNNKNKNNKNNNSNKEDPISNDKIIFPSKTTTTTKSLPTSLSTSPSLDTQHLQPNDNNNNNNNNNNNSLSQILGEKLMMSKKEKNFIPMPLPPRRKRSSKKRRSEATTQPRFNPDTNTYTRDTRANPDHLRMIAAELNMMRSRKLFSPLKPRGFLPRRKDPFICGDDRPKSPLMFEIV